jgi:class 3 adenylate cyclase
MADDSASGRLWKMIEERSRAGSETAAIDEQIWNTFGQEWAIVFTDLVGFSRQVARFGIIHFLQIIHDTRLLLSPIIEGHGGAFVKIEADSFLLLFPTARAAVECSVAMQHACQQANGDRSPEEQLILCVGVGHGRVLRIDTEDVFGHEVNLASRLGEDTAKANEILATQSARTAAGDLPGVRWEERQVEFAGESACWRAIYE